MRSLVAKWLIIGAAILALAACSAVRVGYDQGPRLAMWWLDGWLDLDMAQEAQVRPDIERWFAWHRASQLPGYADLVAQWKSRVDTAVSGAQICAWADEAKDRLWPAVEAALPAAAERLPAVREAQWQYLQRRQLERLADDRKTYLQPRAEDRLAATVDRAVERAEDLYGPLQPAQRELLARAAATSPLDRAAWLAEREARQRALVQALRQAQTLAPAARTAALKAAAERYWRGAEGAEGERQARWRAHNCETSAKLHQSATPAQRAHLRERLAAWEEDLRALAAKGAP